MIRKKSCYKTANAVSSFLCRNCGRGVISIKGLDFANLSAAVTKEASVGGCERRSAVENSRETLKYCPTQSGPYPRVIRLARSMTKDRVTSECADNLHTRPLQLRLRCRRESHRLLTMPSGRRIKPRLCDIKICSPKYRVTKIFRIQLKRENAFVLNYST